MELDTYLDVQKQAVVDDLARRGLLFKPGTGEYSDLAKDSLKALDTAWAGSPPKVGGPR